MVSNLFKSKSQYKNLEYIWKIHSWNRFYKITDFYLFIVLFRFLTVELYISIPLGYRMLEMFYCTVCIYLIH